MSLWVLYGFTTDRNGTVDHAQRLDLDSDGRGITYPAHMSILPLSSSSSSSKEATNSSCGTMQLRNGKNTFDGKLKRVEAERQDLASSCLVWNGMFYHDNTASVHGGVPRGTFNFRLVECKSMPSTPSHTPTFYNLVGSVTSALNIGQPRCLMLCFTSELSRSENDDDDDDDGNPGANLGEDSVRGFPFKKPVPNCLSHFVEVVKDANGKETGDVVVHDLVCAQQQGSVVIADEYRGTWVETSESFKFCGLYRRVSRRNKSSEEEVLDEGTFFFTVSVDEE